ncbi:MAG: AbrB/MazE/SpoVT family DNA-binding domain-containing protein [Gemmatimonadales bacterium]|jgi:antitoxin VapB|nr:AbrB/MazE/SpoVT family DNA-binding domain-containing protein [Gemmatimonadales bacterium]
MSTDRAPDDAPRRARLFRNGRSQAVRLPLAYRFEGDEVSIRREGDAVILEPLARRDWPAGYWARVAREAGLFASFEVGPPLPTGGTDVDLDPR